MISPRLFKSLNMVSMTSPGTANVLNAPFLSSRKASPVFPGRNCGGGIVAAGVQGIACAEAGPGLASARAAATAATTNLWRRNAALLAEGILALRGSRKRRSNDAAVAVQQSAVHVSLCSSIYGSAIALDVAAQPKQSWPAQVTCDLLNRGSSPR